MRSYSGEYEFQQNGQTMLDVWAADEDPIRGGYWFSIVSRTIPENEHIKTTIDAVVKAAYKHARSQNQDDLAALNMASAVLRDIYNEPQREWIANRVSIVDLVVRRRGEAARPFLEWGLNVNI